MSEPDSKSGERASGKPSEVNLGEVLRHARERRGLTLEQLARCLRLEPRIIQYLENNHFEALPAPAFIRGYVRAIARELALDCAPLMAALDQHFADYMPALSDFASREPIQVTSDSNIVRYTTSAVVIVMIALIALWWRSHRDGWPVLNGLLAPPTPAGVAPTAPAPTPPLPYAFAIVTHPDTPFYRAEPPALAAPPDSIADIVIAAREDAWIQVLDVNGERLYYNFVRAGNQVEIQGRRPYSLVIGNAPAVSLLFEGRAVDIESLAEEGVARFQLGQDALAQ